MKGTIISGEEVLKILGEGDLEKMGTVYEIAYTGGPLELTRLGYREVRNVVKDCNSGDCIFIKIER